MFVDTMCMIYVRINKAQSGILDAGYSKLNGRIQHLAHITWCCMYIDTFGTSIKRGDVPIVSALRAIEKVYRAADETMIRRYRFLF